MLEKTRTAGKHFWDWIDGRAVVRRGTLLFTFYMTWYGVHTSWQFAQVSTFDGMGTAAVIAAVLVPITGLQGFAFHNYTKSRSE